MLHQVHSSTVFYFKKKNVTDKIHSTWKQWSNNLWNLNNYKVAGNQRGSL